MLYCLDNRGVTRAMERSKGHHTTSQLALIKALTLLETLYLQYLQTTSATGPSQ